MIYGIPPTSHLNLWGWKHLRWWLKVGRSLLDEFLHLCGCWSSWIIYSSSQRCYFLLGSLRVHVCKWGKVWIRIRPSTWHDNFIVTSMARSEHTMGTDGYRGTLSFYSAYTSKKQFSCTYLRSGIEAAPDNLLTQGWLLGMALWESRTEKNLDRGSQTF